LYLEPKAAFHEQAAAEKSRRRIAVTHAHTGARGKKRKKIDAWAALVFIQYCSTSSAIGWTG
jgi:hypothetical protein